jgi:hypothetical protein
VQTFSLLVAVAQVVRVPAVAVAQVDIYIFQTRLLQKTKSLM